MTSNVISNVVDYEAVLKDQPRAYAYFNIRKKIVGRGDGGRRGKREKEEGREGGRNE